MCAKLGSVESCVAILVQGILITLNVDSEEKGNQNSYTVIIR